MMAEVEDLFPALSRIMHPSMTSHGRFWEDDPTTSKRMEIFLNSSLCVINNLSKSVKHRDKFRTPELRKTLDIYKGSPSPIRRLHSLLAIGYMADPAVDMTLLEDKYGVINDLTRYLDISVRQADNSTGFSIRELVDGLLNLSVHPINKEQIIDKSLPLLYNILEKNDDKKMSLYVREVLDEWGFSDVRGSSATEPGEKETQHTSEQYHDEGKERADDIQMLDNLQCVLSEYEKFGNNDVMEIICAVQQIVSADGRQIILKHMTKNEWPDLLVHILTDVWIPRTEVYIDELLWPIIKNTIDILIAYSDAGVEFVDDLIEYGALNLMQQVADAYYQHFKQKLIALDEKTSEYMGQQIASKQTGRDGHQLRDLASKQKVTADAHLMASNQPEADAHQSVDIASKEPGADTPQMTSNQAEADAHQSLDIASKEPGADTHQMSSNQPETDTPQSMDNVPNKSDLPNPSEEVECDTSNNILHDQHVVDKISTSSSEITQGRESTESVTSYTLKPITENACVNDDSTIAYRKDSAIYNRAVFISNQQVETSKLFELNIDKIDERQNYNSMEFGVCLSNTFTDDTFYEGSGLGEGSGFWFLRDTSLWKDFETIGGGYKLNLYDVHVNDKVGLVKHQDGTMSFLYNGQYQGIAFRNIPEGIYALVATTGKCVQVSITGNAGTTIQHSPCGALKEPFESFSVKTIGTKSTSSLSRLRLPYGLDFTNEEKHPKMRKVYQQRDNPLIRKVYVETERALDPLYEIKQRSTRGYLNEIDIMTAMKYAVDVYTLHSNPSTRVDPISNVAMKYISTSVNMHDMVLKTCQRNDAPPNKAYTLPQRFQHVFDVVRPCFDNIKDMRGIVWTGSTSEGFAIADNSSLSTPYVDDEIDLMIPLAIATEDPNITTCENYAIPEQITSGSAKEIGEIKPEYLVSELEDIGKRQQCKEWPTFTWHPSRHPGYVMIAIPESLQSYTSDWFIKYICVRSTSSSGQTDLLLTRSKLLAIQEEYTRRRLISVEKFKGQLKLVQEGPVQTISVHHESKEPGGSVLAFDQTVDVAIALNGMNWPTIANPWKLRERHWPEKIIVDKIVKGGYHIVPKYFPGGSGIDVEWRLSFSVAERTLAHTLTNNQRKCYMFFKRLWRKYLKEPKVLSSYHLKTTMFWLCERTSSSDWTDSNIGDRFLDLQNFLIHFLKQSNVPNYFIPENNMISNIDPVDVKIILAKTQDVRRRPTYYLGSIIVPSSFLNFT